MYSAEVENRLIFTDIVDMMKNYTAIQPDVDEVIIKAACITAQDIDLGRSVSDTYINMARDPQSDIEDQLREMIAPVVCHFTYYRCLTMYHGTFTDSGYVLDGEADSKNNAKQVANQSYSVAEVYLTKLLNFIEENFSEDVEDAKNNMTPKIRVFGGQEYRASNDYYGQYYTGFRN